MVDPGFGAPSAILSVFGTLVVVLVIGGFAFVIIRGITTWATNNASPVLTTVATLVGKRTQVSGGSGESSASTYYYLTFEVSSQERIELPVNGRVYGQLVEGDRGSLTYQGTRFHEFTREGVAS